MLFLVDAILLHLSCCICSALGTVSGNVQCSFSILHLILVIVQSLFALSINLDHLLAILVR